MTDTDTDVIEQETPVAIEPEGTPSATVVTEEQTTEETPAPPDSEVDAAAKTDDGKTPEQVKEDAAHWQTEYQRSQDELAQLRGEPETPATPETSPTPQPHLTDEEVDEQLRDPRVQMQVQAEQTRQIIRSELADERHRMASTEANRVLQDFRHKQGISDENFKAAEKSILDSGLKGSPAAISSAIIKELNYQRMTGHMAERTTQVEAETADKVKRQMLTVQPGAGGQRLDQPEANKKIADAIAPNTT